MAKQVDYEKKNTYGAHFMQNNGLRAKTQQYFMAVNSQSYNRPTVARSRAHVEENKNDVRNQRYHNVDQSEVSGFRKRSVHLKNVDDSHSGYLNKDRQSFVTGMSCDNGERMQAAQMMVVDNEKKYLSRDAGELNKNERYPARDERNALVEVRTRENQDSFDVRKSFDITNSRHPSEKAESENTTQTSRIRVTAGNVSSGNSFKNVNDTFKDEENRVLSRTGSFDRRKVQIKQADIGVVVNQTKASSERRFEERITNNEDEIASNPRIKQTTVSYRGLNKIEIPKLSNNAEETSGNKITRYENIKQDFRPVNSDSQITRLENIEGRNVPLLRHSYQMGDEKKMNLSSIGEKKSAGFFHGRQGSDPSSHITSSTFKFSSMSSDLMRSKEELINRSKECGRMLEEYRQREEERREQSARNEKRSELPMKPSEGKWMREANDASRKSGVDNASQERKSSQDRIVDDEQGKQSPRYGKRKSSYIDSWLQSQQNRISTLVSAIKEEDSDDNQRKNDNTERQRTTSMPPDSVAFLGRRRSDDSGHECDEKRTSRIAHSRSHSGEEIMGIAKPKETRKFSGRYIDTSEEDATKTGKITSPRNSTLGYNPEDMRARSLFLQQETYSRTREKNGGVKSPRSFQSPNSSIEADDRRCKPTEVVSQRCQSERTSPQLQRSFDASKSCSVGNSPRLRKETTFDSGITTKVVSRRSSAASDYTNKDSPQLRSSSDELQQQNVSSRNMLSRRLSSSSDYVTKEKQLRSKSVSPSNSLSRRSSSSGDFAAKYRRTSSGGTPMEKSLVTSDVDLKGAVSPYQQQEPLNRSGNEEVFDWPAPPELDVFPSDDDLHNQSWPSSTSSPFMNRRVEGNKNFPVAVVKPLQHEKTQSWDGGFERKSDEKSHNKRIETLIDSSPRNGSVTCYNVRLDDGNSRAISLATPRDFSSREIPRDFSSNISQEKLHEKAVDVDYDDSSENSKTSQGLSNLITQDFQWYRPNAGPPEASKASLERDASRESMRDSTQERLGRFKRGSKLLSSKYLSFSKSLENLSKVGKDLIMGKKKGGDEKKEGRKDRPERKSMVVGDLELNDEFAMKMERRSRMSLETANSEESVKKGDHQTEARKDVDVGRRPTSNGLNKSGMKKKETLIDFPAVADDLSSSERRSNSGLNEHFEAKDKPQSHTNKIEQMSDQPGRNGGSLQYRTENRGSRSDVIRRRDVKSAYFEEESETRRLFERPKSEFYSHDDIEYENRKNVSGFEECDESNDEDEKEMVKIVRKISGLRSSQVKIKTPPKQAEKQSRHDNTEESGTTFSSDQKQSSLKENVGTTQVSTRHDSTTQLSDKNRNDTDKPDSIEDEKGEKESLPLETAAKQDVTYSSHQAPNGEDIVVKSSSDPDPMKRISTSLSRVMTDLKELREQDLDLATQLITLGKSIKHFKKQKKEMDDFYAIINEGDSTEDYDSSDDEEEEERTESYSGSRITTDF